MQAGQSPLVPIAGGRDAARIAGAFAGAIALFAAGAAGQEPQTHERLALLVAVQDYPAPPAGSTREAPAALRGSRNDAATVRAMLRQHYGFRGDDIAVLTDADATHKNIVQAIWRHLIQQAGKETSVVLWYSGHGSRVRDRSGKETNKGMLDEYGVEGAFDGSLVCFDSRADDERNHDLIDDELHSLLVVLAGKAKEVLVVTDSCYSGGVTRGGAGAARCTAPDLREWDEAWVRSFWPDDVPLLEDDKRPDDPGQPHYVHIAACSDSERALELEYLPGRHMGVLTAKLTALLRQRSFGSWRELGLQVRTAVAAEHLQTVWFEGAIDEPVFGGRFRALPPGFPALAEGSGRVIVEAGRLHGIGEGTEVELVDLDAKVVGRATSRWVGSSSSVFGIAGEMPPGLREMALVARLQNLPAGRAPLHLGAGEGVDADFLRGCAWAVAAASGDDGAIVRAGEHLELHDPDGYFARTIPADPAGRDEALGREHCYRMLRETIAAVGSQRVSVAVVPTDPGRATAKKPLATYRVEPDGRVMASAPPLLPKSGGGLMTFALKNESREPLHVVLLSVCEDRSVNVVWPKQGRRDNVLEPGAVQQVLVELGPNPDWCLARPMVDRYLAVATTVFADFWPFTSEATLAAATNRTRGGERDGLPAALQLALSGAATRGGGPAPDFGVSWVDVHVSR